ncbi:MAG: kelch repeat-containing protein, partial [Ignavibacteriaceae bacterium]|nr:kelch repeat-containing protein [Ignavibacteriaceae bacterium]
MIKYLLLIMSFFSLTYSQTDIRINKVPLGSKLNFNTVGSSASKNHINSYRTIDGSNSILAFLLEEFEDGIFPPAGWNLEYSGTKFWSLDNLCSGYGIGSGSAKFESYNDIAGDIQSLISTVFIPAGLGDSLKFDHAYAPYSASGAPDDQLEIDYSVDGGTNWSLLSLYHGGSKGELVTAPPTSAYFIPTSTQWGTHSIVLPVGANKLKFKAISGYGNNIYLDNIKVGSQPAYDAGMVSINLSSNYQLLKITPIVTVRNFGTAAPSVFNVKMEITPGGYTSVKQVTNLAPLTFSQVTFDDWSPAIGTYNVKVQTELSGDGNPSNDTMSTFVVVSNDGWSIGAVIPMPTFLGSGCTVNYNGNSFFYSIGGVTNSTLGTEVNRLNINSNSWATVAHLPEQRSVFASSAALGKVYVFGGAVNPSSPVYQNTIYIYDIASDKWSTGPVVLPSVLGWCKAITYQDSLIYLVGGFDGNSPVDQVLLYNANNNTIRSCPSLPVPLFGGALASADTSIVYVGGIDGLDNIQSSTLVGTISQTDRSRINWVSRSPYPSGARFRWDAGSWINNSIIVTGGSSTLDWYTTPECYVYNVGTDSWARMLDKPTPILGSAASGIKLPNGAWRFIISSGYSSSGPTAITDIYFNNNNVTS